MKRIVVKVGSNVLTRKDGKPDITRLSALVDQIVWLRQNDFEVVLVSSGSLACGRHELKVNKKLDSVEQRQLFSAIGQVKLINLYYDLFLQYGIHIGQILTMKENFASRLEYLNQRACMEVMLQNGVLPIVNENDTVSVTELMFTDNDELSGLVASMISAEGLIILSNVDGIYDSLKRNHVIAKVNPGEDVSKYIQHVKSGFGRGGMITKCGIASRIAAEGIHVIIANGTRDNVLIDLIQHPEDTVHTEFLPNKENVSNVKKWIAHSGSFAKGIVHINADAVRKLQGKEATSLLLVGVTSIEGEFEEGDIINIVSPEGKTIAVGRSGYDKKKAESLIGQHDKKPLIHYNYLYLK